MTTTAALAAELDMLTAALDEPGADIAHSLRQLAAHAAAAITSYLGLSVVVSGGESPFVVTALADGVAVGDIRSSLRAVVPGVGHGADRLPVTVHLYAGSPGAFVDLAADLAWLSARPPTDFVLDQNLDIPTSKPGPSLHAASLINQAIGVLIGRGYTPQQARRQLDTEDLHARADRLGAAQLILGNLTAAGAEDTDEALGDP